MPKTQIFTDEQVGSFSDLPIVASPPKKTSVMDKVYAANDKLLGAAWNLSIGFAKAAASSATRASRKIGEAVETYSNIKLSKATEQAVKDLTESQNRLVNQYMALSPDNPERAKLREDIKRTNDLISQFMAQSPQEAAPRSAAISQNFKAVGTAQKVGYAAENIAEFVAAGVGVAKPATGALRTYTAGLQAAGKISPVVRHVANVAGGSLIQGGVAATVKGAQGGTPKEALKTGLITAAISVPFQAVEEYRSTIAKVLNESARKSATQALGPTTKENKRIAEKVVPEMLKRKTVYFSRPGLLSKAEQNIRATGEKIGAEWDKLPIDAKAKVAPIFRDLEAAKEAMFSGDPMKGGFLPSYNVDKYTAITRIQDELLRAAGDDLVEGTLNLVNLRKYLQGLGEEIAKSKGGFAYGITDKATLGAQKLAYESIRTTLNQANPTVVGLNQEYSFWKDVQKVVGDTIVRTRGQAVPLGERIAEEAGAAGSLAGQVAQKGTEGIAQQFAISRLLGASFRLFVRITTSPAWRQVSAVVKDQLAQAIATDNAPAAIAIINSIAVGLGASIKPGEENTYTDSEINAMPDGQ